MNGELGDWFRLPRVPLKFIAARDRIADRRAFLTVRTPYRRKVRRKGIDVVGVDGQRQPGPECRRSIRNPALFNLEAGSHHVSHSRHELGKGHEWAFFCFSFVLNRCRDRAKTSELQIIFQFIESERGNVKLLVSFDFSLPGRYCLSKELGVPDTLKPNAICALQYAKTDKPFKCLRNSPFIKAIGLKAN